MHRRNLDLLGAIGFVVSDMLWALLPLHPLPIGVLLAVPLVFFLPGYTLTQALFPRRAAGTPSPSSQSLILQQGLKTGQPFSAVDYVVLSLGLSIVIDIVTGLLLNLLPAGLQWQAWTLALAMVTGAFALAAILLRRRQPGKQTSAAGWHPSVKDYLLLGLALGVIMLALWLSITRPAQPQPSFTQFWMLPSTQANKSCAVLIGVRNFETTPQTYRIVVTRNGVQVASWSAIMLVPQQEWDRLVPISPGYLSWRLTESRRDSVVATTRSNFVRGVSGDTVVDARLYRLDQPGIIYREVHVTLHSC